MFTCIGNYGYCYLFLFVVITVGLFIVGKTHVTSETWDYHSESQKNNNININGNIASGMMKLE